MENGNLLPLLIVDVRQIFFAIFVLG